MCVLCVCDVTLSYVGFLLLGTDASTYSVCSNIGATWGGKRERSMLALLVFVGIGLAGEDNEF